MNQSPEINELASALSKAQGEMQSAIKDKINPFFKSKYADLGSVWDAARPVLSKNNLAVVQTTEMSGTEIIMVTTLIHSSGQWMKSFLPLILTKKDSQGIGASITYLRRYSLSALVGVVCDNDDDGETAVGRGNSCKTEPVRQPPKKEFNKGININEKIGNAEILAIEEHLVHLDQSNREAFLKWIHTDFSAVKINEIPRLFFDRCMQVINAKIKMMKENERAVA